MLKRFIVPLVAVGLAAVLVITAVHSSFTQSLGVSVRVDSVSDSDQSGFITDVSIDVTNESDHPIDPQFALVWKPQPARWRTIAGPATLAAHERATYQIEPIGAVNAPPLGQDFQVRVNAPNSIVYALSSTVTTQRQDLALKNPSLRWLPGDAIASSAAPIGWNEYEQRGEGDVAEVAPASVFGIDATHLSIEQDGQPDSGGWSHTGLSQEIDFPSQPFDVTVLSRAIYKTSNGQWPLDAFGIQVSDASKHVSWLLFEDTGKGDLEYDLPDAPHMKIYDVHSGEWARRTVDLADLYRRMDWAPTATVTLTVFIGASSHLAQQFDGYVASIQPTSATRQVQ